jgi:hypothetical protein
MDSPSQSRMEERIPREDQPIAPELLKDEPLLFSSMRPSLRSSDGVAGLYPIAYHPPIA